MIDVSEKVPTRRRAIARGRIEVGERAAEMIRAGKLPKGDVLGLAEVAGIQAAKATAQTLPLCHPLPLEKVEVRLTQGEDRKSILAECETLATAKTGVEMEALAGVQGALLAVYDLVKGVEPALWISDVHLVQKEGGKRGLWRHPHASEAKPAVETSSGTWAGLRTSVLTVSDSVSTGQAEDTSGPSIREFLEQRGATVVTHQVVPDEMELIAGQFEKMAAVSDVVISTGGTGLGPRDVTPEALRKVARQIVPGLGEALRSGGARYTERAWLSRGEGARVGEALVVCLPGSLKAVRQGLEVLDTMVPHALAMARGGGHPR